MLIISSSSFFYNLIKKPSFIMAGICDICDNFQMYNPDSTGEMTIACIVCKYSDKIKEQKNIFFINNNEIEIEDKEITLLMAKQNISPYYEDYCSICKTNIPKKKIRLVPNKKNNEKYFDYTNQLNDEFDESNSRYIIYVLCPTCEDIKYL